MPNHQCSNLHELVSDRINQVEFGALAVSPVLNLVLPPSATGEFPLGLL